MKTRILKALAIAGVATFAFAQPAAAVSINMVVNGSDVEIYASSLGGQPITAWDFDITFNSALTIADVFTDNQLGDTGLSDDADLDNDETVFDWFDLGGGLLDVFEVSLLSDADLVALQAGADPIKLVTIRFSDEDLSNGGFAFAWDRFNDVKCAENQVCYPVATPEPGTLALLGLGMLGMALTRRRVAA